VLYTMLVGKYPFQVNVRTPTKAGSFLISVVSAEAEVGPSTY
jgi:hypothetical protein